MREPNPLVNTPRRYICDPFSPYHTYIEVGQALSWTSPHFLLTLVVFLSLRVSLFSEKVVKVRYGTPTHPLNAESMES